MNLYKILLLFMTVFFLSSCENLSMNSLSGLLFGKQTPKDSDNEDMMEKAYQSSLPECEISNPKGCNYLGIYYASKGDFENAIPFLQKSCNLHDESGCAIEIGVRIDQEMRKHKEERNFPDEEKVNTYFESYCGNEDKLMLIKGAVCYSASNYYTEKNQGKKAYTFINRACDFDYENSCGIKADFLFKGEGVKKNEKEAIDIYQENCAVVDGSSCFKLASLYYSGVSKEIKKNEEKGFELLDRACTFDYSLGCAGAGRSKYKGEGTTQDFKEAFKYYEKGASLNEYFSIVNLGYFYLNGVEVPQDITKAKELYLKACSINPELKESFKEYSTYGKTACEVANEL